MRRIIQILVVVIFCLCTVIFVGRMIEVNRLRRQAEELQQQKDALNGANDAD